MTTTAVQDGDAQQTLPIETRRRSRRGRILTDAEIDEFVEGLRPELPEIPMLDCYLDGFAQALRWRMQRLRHEQQTE